MTELLRVKDLFVEYDTFEGTAKAINGLNFEINEGEAVGLVGESGAGKTTFAKSVLRLLPSTATITRGEILFRGENLLTRDERYMRSLRGREMAMIFQNPLTSLNPVIKVGVQIANVLAQNLNISRAAAEKRSHELLEMVGIPGYRWREYPHEFSGGMRQRVGIAIALACEPSLMIADEPTTALDVTIQAQVLELMNELRARFSMALVMITHAMGIVGEMCSKVAVMYAGRAVEKGTVEEVFTNPRHPYTEALFRSMPSVDVDAGRLQPVPGSVANALDLPQGCAFWPRCEAKTERCTVEAPKEVEIGSGHYVACWLS